MQTGVIRSNCLDCLDRTNFFQQRVSLYALTQEIFPSLNINFKSTTDKEKFLKEFQHAWEDCNDTISLHYAGVNATSGGGGGAYARGVFGFLKGKISSAKRFFTGRLTDSLKQQCYCMLLGMNVF